jgi:predicted nucleic acid-binding protein
MRFWDSSAIVPLLVREPSSPRSKALLREDPVVLAWWAAEVECTSALARLERDQSLSRKASVSAYQRLAAFRDAWNEVQPTAGLKETATRLLRVHVLRAADALQLAAAILAAEGRPSTLGFVCFDECLASAARKEGFEVVGP